MIVAALAEKWGPFPAAIWIMAGALGLYLFARKANSTIQISGETDVALDAPGPSSSEPCCDACIATPNRLMGLLPHQGLPAPLVPWVSLTTGPNWAAVSVPTALGDAEIA